LWKPAAQLSPTIWEKNNGRNLVSEIPFKSDAIDGGARLGFCYIIRALHFLRFAVTKKNRLIFWLIFFTLLFLTGHSHAEKPHYDFIICGARVIDGTGAPWYVADIGIIGDRLAAIGDLSKVSAAKRLNAAGLFASPGFIDVQGQSEFNILVDNRAASKITQGVTTEITGEGNSIAPVNDRLRKDLEEKAIKYGVTLDWYSLADIVANPTGTDKRANQRTFGTRCWLRGAKCAEVVDVLRSLHFQPQPARAMILFPESIRDPAHRRSQQIQ
jgi:hypothetical protein